MTNAFYNPAAALNKAEYALMCELQTHKSKLDAAIRCSDKLAIRHALGLLENSRSALMRIQVISAGKAA